MTVVQQENRVHGSAKKQLHIRGTMTSLRGVSMAHRSRVWTHASFSEQILSVSCPARES